MLRDDGASWRRSATTTTSSGWSPPSRLARAPRQRDQLTHRDPPLRSPFGDVPLMSAPGDDSSSSEAGPGIAALAAAIHPPAAWPPATVDVGPARIDPLRSGPATTAFIVDTGGRRLGNGHLTARAI